MGYVLLERKKINITSSEILDLNSTPQTLLSGVSGEILEVVSVVGSINFNSSAYDTNTELIVHDRSDTSNTLFNNTNLLTATSNRIESFGQQGQGVYVKGNDIQISVSAGDPANGDSDMDIEITFKRIKSL